MALGENPAASLGGRRKCYFCLLLSLIWHWLPGRGGQGRPLQLCPAHREFSKDAHGCLEDGRRGRGGWAGPPNPPPKKKKAGAGQQGRRKAATVPDHSAASLRMPGAPAQPQPGQQPAPWMGRVALAPCCDCLASQAVLTGLESRQPELLQIEAALFLSWALQSSRRWPALSRSPSGEPELPFQLRTLRVTHPNHGGYHCLSQGPGLMGLNLASVHKTACSQPPFSHLCNEKRYVSYLSWLTGCRKQSAWC